MQIANRTKQWFIFSLLALTPLIALSAINQWQIVPNESQLSFTGIQNNAPVSGEFKKFSGNILFDSNDLKNSHIDVIVDINSLSISYVEMKETLLMSDWFNAKLFPKAEFKSTQIARIDEKTYRAKGSLSIRDKTLPIVLIFKEESATPEKVIMTGSTIIKRTQFGVGQGEWANTSDVKDDVVVNFKVVAVKK